MVEHAGKAPACTAQHAQHSTICTASPIPSDGQKPDAVLKHLQQQEVCSEANRELDQGGPQGPARLAGGNNLVLQAVEANASHEILKLQFAASIPGCRIL